MIRKIFGVIVGVVIGGVLIFVIEMMGHQMFPPPPGMDFTNPASVKAVVDQIPIGALWLVLLSWFLGAFIGAWVGSKIAAKSAVAVGLIVGLILYGMGIVTMIMIPHPVWFMAGSLLVFIPPAYVGGWLNAGRENQAVKRERIFKKS